MRLLMVMPAVALSLSASDLEQEMQSLLQRRCLSCHGPKTKTAGLDLSTPDGIERRGERTGTEAGLAGSEPAARGNRTRGILKLHVDLYQCDQEPVTCCGNRSGTVL